MSSWLPRSVELMDLMSEGQVGLIEAVERFQLDTAASFETFATWRVRGAMLDFLRREDWLSRPARDQVKEVEGAVQKLEPLLGRAPLDEEIVAHLSGAGGSRFRWSVGLVRESLANSVAAQVMSMGELLRGGEGLRVEGLVSDRCAVLPDEGVVSGDQLVEVRRAIAGLDEREQLVVTLYFFEELTLSDIGIVLGLSETRVSQLLKKLLIVLEGALAA